MKLGTLKSQSLDGILVIVSKDNQRYVEAREIDKELQNLRVCIESWSKNQGKLSRIYEDLNTGKIPGKKVDERLMHSPLPRAFQWLDGSAFVQHIKLVRKSRGAEIPETLYEIPLIYQGSGDSFLGPRDDIPKYDKAFGTDFEGEVGVIVNDVPQGVSPEEALDHIVLICLINDVSLRGLAPEELKRGFGFVQSKPSSAFAPFALTPDELNQAWKNGRVCLPLNVEFNDQFFGCTDAGAMHFHFGQIISHACLTRELKAGTIVGSGTVSDENPKSGYSCLVEKRTYEKIHEGEAKQRFMQEGDRVKIEMNNENGENLFGTIYQKVRKS